MFTKYNDNDTNNNNIIKKKAKHPQRHFIPHKEISPTPVTRPSTAATLGMTVTAAPRRDPRIVEKLFSWELVKCQNEGQYAAL
jgi:hypothetical protein